MELLFCSISIDESDQNNLPAGLFFSRALLRFDDMALDSSLEIYCLLTKIEKYYLILQKTKWFYDPDDL